MKIDNILNTDEYKIKQFVKIYGEGYKVDYIHVNKMGLVYYIHISKSRLFSNYSSSVVSIGEDNIGTLTAYGSPMFNVEFAQYLESLGYNITLKFDSDKNISKY